MSVTDLMAITHDRGFRHRVEFALFDVAKDMSVPIPTGEDLDYVNAILVGEARLDPVVTAMVVINATAETDTDVVMKTNIEVLWPFLAKAWAARTV